MRAARDTERTARRDLETLLAACRHVLGDGGPLEVPAATTAERLTDAAAAQGVLVMLARAVPRDAATRGLHARADEEVVAALLAGRQLRSVLDALSAAGVPALVLKGPALSAALYGDPAVRGRSVDLDVAVRRRDLARAVDAMLPLGYGREEPGVEARDTAAASREAHLYPRGETSGRRLVEIHTELEGNPGTPSISVDEVWDRTADARVFGATARRLAPEDELLYLCIHGARHMWRRLVWVCDVAATVRRHPDLDWDAVERRAAAVDAPHRLALGLHLAARWFGADSPERLRSGRRLVRLERLVTRRMVDAAVRTRLSTRWLFAGELAARETTVQRLAYVRSQLAPTDRDRAWLSLPAPLEPVWWLLRPVRLLVRWRQGR